MGHADLQTLVHALGRRAAADGTVSDAELLRRHRADGDSAALELLVWRHGTAVLRVCRGVLGTTPDTEDAFQATFLALARYAPAIRNGDSLLGWLLRVAKRTAVRVRVRGVRRARVETPLPDAVAAPEPSDDDWSDLRPVLDEEIARLPEPFRRALVLCHLEGKSNDEAAHILGCPVGTVYSRLCRARRMLRDQLTRRGVLGVGLLSVDLVAATVNAAQNPSPLIPLVEETMRTLVLTKVKAWTAIVAVAVLGVGTTATMWPTAPADQPAAAGGPLFRDVTEASGVRHEYRNGEEADHYAILEAVGGGAAVLDYDSDGRPDLYLPSGGSFEGPDKRTIRGRGGRLYRNLGDLKFEDATEKAGLAGLDLYTQGAAVGDVDGDSWPDLFVTGYGRVVLYRNEADGRGGRRFADVTAKAGLPMDGVWATGAAIADLDADGHPDIYVCQYVNWSWQNHPNCSGYTTGKQRDLCPPKQFEGRPHRLYRNRGDGTFADVSKDAGLVGGRDCGKGLGVVVADLDGDGLPDLYVANDTTDNFLYLNRSKPGAIRLEERGLVFGVARDANGTPNGTAGVVAGDFDGTGRPALFAANYENEHHALYRNLDRGFVYGSPIAGLSALGSSFVGFGAAFVDADNDGWLDLAIAHGHTLRHPPRDNRRQRPVLLRNEASDGGKRRFRDLGESAGGIFQRSYNGRGLVVADLDSDGRPDLLLVVVNEPARVVHNESPAAHWLGIELIGRDATGAKLTLLVGGRTPTRFATAGGGYLSSSDRRIVFGLGSSDEVGRLTVEWPSGEPRVQHFDGLAVDRYHKLERGRSR